LRRLIILGRSARIWALIVMAALVCVLPGAAGARAERMEVVSPSAAWNRFLARWNDFREHLEKGESADAAKQLDQVLSAKWDGGLGDLPVHATALIRWAEKLYQRGDRETAERLTEYAQKLAPGSFRVQLSLARYYLGGGPVEPGKSVSYYLASLRTLEDDFGALYWLGGRFCIYPLVFMGLLGSVLGLTCLFRYGVLLFHDFSDLFPARKMPVVLSDALCILVLGLPLAAGLSWWWLVSWWLLVMSLYMKRGEVVLACLWFIFLLSAPVLLSRYSVFAATRSDAALYAALRVRNGVPTGSDRSVLEEALQKRPDDLLARFSLAQLLQREGRFNKAVSVYEPLLKDKRTAQEAYNNIAEIYLWDGQLEPVFRALSAAVDSGGPRAEVLFNLGQYYQEAEQLVRMDEQYKAASAINQKKVEQLTARGGEWKLNRFMASLPVPRSLVWERSVSGSAMAGAAFPAIWNAWMGQPSGLEYLGVVIAGPVLILLLRIIGKGWNLSSRCSSCGRPICLTCQKPPREPGICTPCYNVFKGEGGVDLKVKMQKRSEVQRYRDIWSRSGLALAILAPGSGHMLLGWTGAGALLFSCVALAWSVFITRWLMWPEAAPSYHGGVPGYGIVLVLVYLILVVISVLNYRARIDRWR